MGLCARACRLRTSKARVSMANGTAAVGGREHRTARARVALRYGRLPRTPTVTRCGSMRTSADGGRQFLRVLRCVRKRKEGAGAILFVDLPSILAVIFPERGSGM